METFFGSIMYVVFGKRWLFWQMKQGYKGAMFVNEAEIAMTKYRLDGIVKEIEEMQKQLVGFKENPPHEWHDFVPKGVIPTSEKQEYDAKKKCDEQNKVVMDGLANTIAKKEKEKDKQNAEYAQLQGIALSNRLKWDFLNNYKIKKTYADKGYADQFKK